MFPRLLALALCLCLAAAPAFAELIVIDDGQLDRLDLGPGQELEFNGGTIGLLSNLGGLANMYGGMLTGLDSQIGDNGELNIYGVDSGALLPLPNDAMRVSTTTENGNATIKLHGYNFRHFSNDADNEEFSFHAIQGWLLDGSWINLRIRRNGTALMNHLELKTYPGNADADGDWDMDLDDLNAVRNNFDGEGFGDVTNDGLVNLDDLNRVRNYFGNGYGDFPPELEFSGVIPLGSQVVPEPSSILLLMAALTAMPLFARCRASRR